VIANGRGRAIAFALGYLPDVPGWIVGDRGFASDAFRERIWNLGARPAIPPRRTHRLPGVDLRQPPSRREPLGTVERMARRRHPIRKDRAFFPRHTLPRRYCRLAQVIKL
jgi:hypothetical protein